MSNEKSKLQFKSIANVTKETLYAIDQRRKGLIKPLKTPWKKWNYNCGGIEWNNIICIGGMSGSGKTAIANQLETGLKDLNGYERFSILSFNFEMLATRLIGRKLSNFTKMTMSELFNTTGKNLINDNLYKSLERHCESLNKYDIYYVDMPGSVSEIEETIHSFIKYVCAPKNHKCVVMLDHVLLINGDKESDVERKVLFDLMSMENRLKKTYTITFINLCQLNRNIERIERLTDPVMHYPQKADVFGAESMYQFSDIFLITHRPEMLNLPYYGPNKLPVKDKIYWHFIKVRDGEPFVASMSNNLKYNEVLDGE